MQGRETILGGGIGLIAAFLGVGGSVMTVPLMRRRGATMAQAAAMANLLTLPLAATASLTWLLMAPMAALPSGFIGNIWWLAAGLLVAGSWLGLRGASRWLAKTPRSLARADLPATIATGAAGDVLWRGGLKALADHAPVIFFIHALAGLYY